MMWMQALLDIKKDRFRIWTYFSFGSDDALRSLAVKVCREVNPDIQVFEGRIASGDQFVADQGVKDVIVSEFGAYAVEMEGAAIAHAAYLNHVPCLVVRAISDKADGSAEVDILLLRSWRLSTA